MYIIALLIWLLMFLTIMFINLIPALIVACIIKALFPQTDVVVVAGLIYIMWLIVRR